MATKEFHDLDLFNHFDLGSMLLKHHTNISFIASLIMILF